MQAAVTLRKDPSLAATLMQTAFVLNVDTEEVAILISSALVVL